MPRIAVSVLLVTLLAVGTACSSDDDPNAEPTGGASSTPSTPTSAPTDDPSDDPSDDPTASVAPATGPLLDLPHSSVRIPEGWRVKDQIVPQSKEAQDNDSYSGVSLGEEVSFADSLSPDELADLWFQVNPYPKKPKRLPVTELDGVEVYHLAGQVQKFLYLEQFGAQVDGKLVDLTFTFSPEVHPEERQEIIDSVVATFQWK